MPSTFTWLDYSEHERRKMLDVIDLFGEKSTRDELNCHHNDILAYQSKDSERELE